MRRCLRSGKVRHPDESAARQLLRILTQENHFHGTTYRCPYCEGWHLTRRVPRPPAVEWDGVTEGSPPAAVLRFNSR